MNATVDREECTGCKVCAKVCPEVFRIDDRKAVVGVSHVPGNLEGVCRRIAMDCPAGAVRIGEAQAVMMVENERHNRLWVAL